MKQMARRLLLELILLIGNGSSYVPVWTDGEVPFVPTPPEVVDRMLEMAQVKSGDVIYDLGSGDGRIIIRAAKRYGVKGIGIEIDAELQKAKHNAFREKVDPLVDFADGGCFTYHRNTLYASRI